MDHSRLNDPEDARLEALLCQRAAPLSDDGFSARVIQALPRRQRSTAIWFGASGAIVGAVIALTQIASHEPVVRAVTDLGRGVGTLIDPFVLSAAIIAALVAVYALRPGHGARRWI